MGGLPVAVNKNLNQQQPNQLPVAGTGDNGILGGVKVDGTTVTIDAEGVISSTGGGGGTVTGSGTAGFVPIWDTATDLTDSVIDDGVTEAGQLTITKTNTGGGIDLIAGTGGVNLIAAGPPAPENAGIELDSDADVFISGNETAFANLGIVGALAFGGPDNSGANSDNCGTLTLVAGTASYDFQFGRSGGGPGYDFVPVVIVQDQNFANQIHTVLTVTNTGFTIENATGTTDTYNYICFPRDLNT
jgi:hypothetical protein